MFCPNCGSNVPDGSPYCPTCGTPSRGQQNGEYHQESSDIQNQHQQKPSGPQGNEADPLPKSTAEESRQTGDQEEASHSRQEDTDPYRQFHQEGSGQSRQGGPEQYQQFQGDARQSYQEDSRQYHHNGQQFRQQRAGQYQQQYYQRPQPRTRLGVTVGMLGAIIYFSALISPVILILLAVYVLMMEDNRWLKGSAIKCVVFYLVFFFIFQIIDGINYFLNIINRMIDFMVRWNPGFAFPGSITDLLSIGQIAFFVIMGFGAFKMREIRIRKIDEFVETHM